MCFYALTLFSADLSNGQELRRYLRACCNRDRRSAQCQENSRRFKRFRDIQDRRLGRQSNNVRAEESRSDKLRGDESRSRKRFCLNLSLVDGENQSLWRARGRISQKQAGGSCDSLISGCE